MPSIQSHRASRVLLAAWLGVAALPAKSVVRGEPAGALQGQIVMLLGSRGFCSAAVLAPDVVLTAAHCVGGAGDYRVFYRDEAGGPVFIEPAAIAIHPLYDRAAIAARRKSIDLALVRLAKPLPGRFTPARLTTSAAPAIPGEVYLVAGFGLAVEGAPKTGGQLRSARLAVSAPYGPSKILLWLVDPAAGKGQPGSGACTGDSGGPLFDAQGDLAAVTTWAEGAGKAKCGALTQGVLVGPQRSWIDGVMAGWRS